MIDILNPRSAVFSTDRRYRYALIRSWHPGLKPLLFIGLNPSTANEITDDPTIARLTHRAYLSGYGSLMVANLFALVSSEPSRLLSEQDPVGPDTDAYLGEMVRCAGMVLVAWGSFTGVRQLMNKRIDEIRKLVQEPYCLGTTKDGFPKHPLYISYKVPFEPYEWQGEGVGGS
jgi:hypothetical protein